MTISLPPDLMERAHNAVFWTTLITANQPFGAWGEVFPDPAMTLAAVDGLVHYATIFEINVETQRSYVRSVAKSAVFLAARRSGLAWRRCAPFRSTLSLAAYRGRH